MRLSWASFQACWALRPPTGSSPAGLCISSDACAPSVSALTAPRNSLHGRVRTGAYPRGALHSRLEHVTVAALVAPLEHRAQEQSRERIVRRGSVRIDVETCREMSEGPSAARRTARTLGGQVRELLLKVLFHIREVRHEPAPPAQKLARHVHHVPDARHQRSPSLSTRSTAYQLFSFPALYFF